MGRVRFQKIVPYNQPSTEQIALSVLENTKASFLGTDLASMFHTSVYVPSQLVSKSMVRPSHLQESANQQTTKIIWQL